MTTGDSPTGLPTASRRNWHGSPSLGVAAHTSASQYRDPQRSVREIGQALGVKVLMEGTVHVDAQTVRLEIRLVDAALGRKLWVDDFVGRYPTTSTGSNARSARRRPNSSGALSALIARAYENPAFPFPSNPTSYAQPEARLPHPVPHALCHRGRRRLAGARDRGNGRHLLVIQPDAVAAAAGACSRPAGEPLRARAQAWQQLLQSGGPVRSGLHLPDVPRSREGTGGFHWHRRPPNLRRQPGLQRADAVGLGHARIGELLPAAGHSACPRPHAQPRRRPRRRGVARRRAQLQLLAEAIRPQPRRPERRTHRQRAEPYDRWRRAPRVRRHHAWVPT